MLRNREMFDMKEKIPLYIIGAFVLFLLVTALTGCRTKSVTEYVAVHDTTYSVTRDTVTKIKTEYSHDTLRIEVEKIVTLNEGGDTIRVAVYRDRWRDRIVRQTDTVRVAKTDTIYRAQAQKEKQTVVKGATWWEKAKFAAIIALCCVVLIKGNSLLSWLRKPP